MLVWLFSWTIPPGATTQPLELSAKFYLNPQSVVAFLVNSSSLAIVELACDVLDRMLSQSSFAVVLQSYLHLLIAGLESKLVPANKLALSLIRRGTYSDADLHALTSSPILAALISALSIQDSDVAKSVSDILVEIGSRSSAFLELLLSDANVSLLNAVSEDDMVVKLRVYELVALISMSSAEAFAICERSHILSPLTNEIFTNDILETLNILEILQKFSETQTGLAFLDKTQVLAKIFALLQQHPDDMSDIYSRLSLCAAIKFWGFLYFHQHTHISELQAKYDLFGALQSFLEEGSDDVKVEIEI
eukprot:jgi/Hompol1/2081/HPOL_003787-RA